MGLPVPDYPDYTIETDGKVYSKIRNRWLKATLGNNGYYGIELRNNKGHKRLSIHRLVALTYIPNPKNLPFVNHKDEVKTNNNVNNLEWCTHKYNITYGSIQERRKLHTDYSKLSYKENAIKNGKSVCRAVSRFTKEGNYLDSFESARDAARQLSLTSNHITECCNKKRKSSNGFIWRYEGGNDLSDCQL